MNSYRRILFIVFSVLVVVTSAGLVLTSDWGAQMVLRGKPQSRVPQSPVNTQQFQTAQALAVLATSPEEQNRARDALRFADHEVDFAFTAALYQAESQTVPSTPEITAIRGRIAKAQKSVADMTSEIARLTKLQAGAKENQKDALAREIDLTSARLELNQDELADADQDLERAGGDPQSRIQRMVDEHKASDQSTGGQVDLSIVGRQASATLPASYAFLSRARAWIALHSMLRNLDQAEQDATAAAEVFSKTHDRLELQLEAEQSEQSTKLSGSSSGTAASTTTLGKRAAGAPSPTSGQTPNQTSDAISAYRSLTSLQKRMSAMDTRIRNQQDLAANYAQWSLLTAARQRSLEHGIFVSVASMLLIALGVLIADRSLVRIFDRLEPDQKNLLTLRGVAHFVSRAAGLCLILLVIFGLPNQTATILALAGAGLTVALKDFIVGFFGWFVLMGKNGIRHGDWVEINGVSGEVIEIGLFYTVLLETGNWNDSGHPTGRRVRFVNSYAIEGQYFNFSTSGQWLWDEIEIVLPMDRDPYLVVSEIQSILTKETQENARLAEQEWKQMGSERGIKEFSAGPAISIRPANLAGFDVRIRYVTRANERHQQKSKIYQEIVELMRQRNIPEPATPPTR